MLFVPRYEEASSVLECYSYLVNINLHALSDEGNNLWSRINGSADENYICTSRVGYDWVINGRAELISVLARRLRPLRGKAAMGYAHDLLWNMHCNNLKDVDEGVASIFLIPFIPESHHWIDEAVASIFLSNSHTTTLISLCHSCERVTYLS